MKINPYVFRGYDLRGIAEKDLNPEIAEHLGKTYGTFLSRREIKGAVVGHDCRLTSESYSDAIIRGMLSAGIDVVDIGLTLAGTVYWAQYYFKARGCVLVSASHNPAEYNGFKFGTGFSSTMISGEIQELRAISEKGEFSRGFGKLEKKDIKEDYFKDLLKRFPFPFKFKVAVDAGHSTPGVFVPFLLERAGCEVVCSHCDIDGNFPDGTPDPTSKEMAQRLAKKILEEKADLGFSFDSDGDRIGVVDENGNILWNDVLVALFAKDALEKKPGAKIVFNSLCSKAVEDSIRAGNGKAVMWRTGHSFIKEKAQKENAIFAGELSGHFYFLDEFYPHDDGCYSSLRLLSYLSKIKKPLSQALAGLSQYVSSPEIKIFAPDDKKTALVAKIAFLLKKDFSVAEIIDDERVADGIRVNFPDGMFVIRYSQNGPYLTVKFEAKTKERYSFLQESIKRALGGFEEINWNSEINVNADLLTPIP